MSVYHTPKQGHTAQPLLTGAVVGVIFWLVLTMAGNDMVSNAEAVGTRTSVAVLAVLKDASIPVAGGIGLLVFIWLWQMRKSEDAGKQEAAFLDWSAELPQWRPQKAHGETAAFFVPVARVESGEFQRSMPVNAAASIPALKPVAAGGAPAPVPLTQSIPVVRLMPLQQMAERFAAARLAGMQPAAPRMPLAVVPPEACGLVRANRMEIPANLPLATLARMPRTEMERLVGEYYRRLGYDVAALGEGVEEAGVDLLLQRRGEVLVVKCLPGSGEPIAPETARELLGLVMGEGATRGILITTGGFSRKTVKFVHQKGRGRLELIDGRKLESLLRASAAGAGTSPACPCCKGPMKLAQKKKRFGRNSMSWICDRAPSCQGVIRQGQPAAA